MARVWQPLENPAFPATRSRSTIHPNPGNAPTQWGQRPMFSEPGPEQPPPDEGMMQQETRVDAITPVDGRQGAEGVTEVAKEEVGGLVPFVVTNYNTASPPTDANIRAAQGRQANLGDTFVIRDGTGAAKLWLIVRGGGDTYYYLGLTKAL